MAYDKGRVAHVAPIMPVAHSNEFPLLTLNAGSSSLKFAVFEGAANGARRLTGKLDRIGLPGGHLTFTELPGGRETRRDVTLESHLSCLPHLQAILHETGFEQFGAVSHRVVHGGPSHTAPKRVDAALLEDLRRLVPFAPNHLPSAIALMEAVAAQWPRVVQVACFDTAFHRTLPTEARLMAIPRRYAAQGVRRYGFHGLAFESVLAQLRERSGGALPARVILAHLGNGASMAAVRDGVSVDTTMGFTPAGGLVMSTRSGDIDPGLVSFLAARGSIELEQFERLFFAESGLLGLSETSSDVRDLLAREASDVRATEALAVFCQRARKFIGALAAVLGGLDALVFSGGIGENSAVIRERLCARFEFLGMRIDPALNSAGASVISTDQSAVSIEIIRADEEQILAASARALQGQPGRTVSSVTPA